MRVQVDLSEWMEREALSGVYDLLQILHDEEHESDDPDRLGAFEQLVASEQRTERSDAELVPWLLTFIWLKSFPDYTRHAWRTLQAIAADPELLAPEAEAILRHHPHGDLRAEVLNFSEARHPEYLESERFLEIIRELAASDPAPRVRAQAWNFLEYVDAVGIEQLPALERLPALVEATVRDPAAEVRVVAMRLLSKLRFGGSSTGDEDASRQQRKAQETALARADNTWVLPSMMQAFLRTNGIHSDPDRAAFALDLLASRPDLPRRTELVRALSWQIPWGAQDHGVAAERWIAAAPHGSAEGFLEHLRGLFRDDRAPVDARADALHALAAYGQLGPIPLQAALDFYLLPDLRARELVTVMSANKLVRGLFALPNPPVSQASDRVELLSVLVERTRTLPTLEEVKSAAMAVHFAADAALAIVCNPTMSPGRAQPLLDAAISAVLRHPGDASFGLYGLRDVPATLRLDVLAREFPEASEDARNGVPEYAAIAYGRHGSDDRLAALRAGLDGLSSNNALLRLARELPEPSRLEPDHRVALEDSLRAALDRLQPEAWVRDTVEAWLRHP